MAFPVLICALAAVRPSALPLSRVHQPMGVMKNRVLMADSLDTTAAKERIEQMIADNRLMLFIKGTSLMPMCGFSNAVVQVFNSMNVPFETFDVLSDPEVRQGIKEFSNWPTIPQVYVGGEFIGGCDIVISMAGDGTLQEMVEKTLAE